MINKNIQGVSLNKKSTFSRFAFMIQPKYMGIFSKRSIVIVEHKKGIKHYMDTLYVLRSNYQQFTSRIIPPTPSKDHYLCCIKILGVRELHIQPSQKITPLIGKQLLYLQDQRSLLRYVRKSLLSQLQ